VLTGTEPYVTEGQLRELLTVLRLDETVGAANAIMSLFQFDQDGNIARRVGVCCSARYLAMHVPM